MFKDTSLNAVEKLGGMEPVGAGTFGGTVWTTTALIQGAWKDTSLNAVEKLGGMEPVGAGTFGGTVWTATI